jgi:tetratricopeptide (TPR) repeat protein
MKLKIALFLLLSLSINLQAQKGKEKKLLAVAEALQTAVTEQDQAALDDLFDKEEFMNLIIIEDGSTKLARFNEGFKSKLVDRSVLSTMILQQASTEDFAYEPVRVYFDKKEPHIIFRLSVANGINYHDFLLKKSKGNYKIIDAYIYLSGEYISATFKRLYIIASKDYLPPSISAGLPDFQLEEIMQVANAKQLVDQGHYKEAAEMMSGLGADIRKEKIFALMELLIKANMEEEDYLQAMVDYKSLFPEDPSIDLVSLDYLLLQEKFEEGLAAIDRLDERLGGDPYLDIYRGSFYYSLDNYSKATVLFQRFTQNFPDDTDGWDSLINVYIEDKKYAEALGVFDVLIEKYGLGKSDMAVFIEEEPTYADFIKSEAYKNWLKP